MSQIEWIEVREFEKPIGAVGFLNHEAVIIASYFVDADANQDGRVSMGEWLVYNNPLISLQGRYLATVAKVASLQIDVIMRDASIGIWANQLFLTFAAQAVSDGFYAAYFRMPVSRGAGVLAGALVRGRIKQFVVKKAAEAAVKKAFDEAVRGG
jgi:hypothetical protein